MRNMAAFLIFIFLMGYSALSWGQNANTLPTGETTFLDQNGQPLAGGSVFFYVPFTTTLKTTWQDSLAVTPNPNPVILDAAGRAIIYGRGQYSQLVEDQFGNIIWNKIIGSGYTSYSPGLTCTSGSPSVVTSTGSYSIIGSTVFVNIQVDLVNIGNCAGFTSLTLPFAPAVTTVISGREINTTGHAITLTVLQGASSGVVVDYISATLLVNGYIYAFTGSYEMLQ